MLAWALAGVLAAVDPVVDQPAPETPKVTVTFTASVKEYDPFKPSNGVLRCVLKNVGDRPVSVPSGYDGKVVQLTAFGGRFPMNLFSRANPVVTGMVDLAPGKEQVVFELPLDEVLLQTEGAEKKWGWNWRARSMPPRSPVYQAGGKAFVDRVMFQVFIKFGAASVASAPAVVEVKPGRPPEKKEP
jgi:hypothetical protein